MKLRAHLLVMAELLRQTTGHQAMVLRLPATGRQMALRLLTTDHRVAALLLPALGRQTALRLPTTDHRVAALLLLLPATGRQAMVLRLPAIGRLLRVPRLRRPFLPAWGPTDLETTQAPQQAFPGGLVFERFLAWIWRAPAIPRHDASIRR